MSTVMTSVGDASPAVAFGLSLVLFLRTKTYDVRSVEGALSAFSFRVSCNCNKYAA